MMVSKLSNTVHNKKMFVGPQGRLLIVCLIASGLSGLASLFSLATALYTQRLAAKPFPSLVQMADGTSAQIVFEDPNYISPETIKSFVSNTLYHSMAQTSFEAGETEVSTLNPQRVKAIAVPIKLENGQKRNITQNAFLATEAMEPTFAKGFRQTLAQMTHNDVFKGTEEVLLDIARIKEPEKVLNANGEWTGKWTVDVIATLRVYRLNQGEVNAVPFNKQVTVKPINSPRIYDVEKYGEMAQMLNIAQSASLQITNIEEIKLNEVF